MKMLNQSEINVPQPTVCKHIIKKKNHNEQDKTLLISAKIVITMKLIKCINFQLYVCFEGSPLGYLALQVLLLRLS